MGRFSATTFFGRPVSQLSRSVAKMTNILCSENQCQVTNVIRVNDLAIGACWRKTARICQTSQHTDARVHVRWTRGVSLHLCAKSLQGKHLVTVRFGHDVPSPPLVRLPMSDFTCPPSHVPLPKPPTHPCPPYYKKHVRQRSRAGAMTRQQAPAKQTRDFALQLA